MRPAALRSLALAALLACTRPRTEVVIGITTDFEPTVLRSFGVTVFRGGFPADGGMRRWEMTYDATRGAGPTGGRRFLGELGVERGEGSPGTFWIEVRGCRNDNCGYGESSGLLVVRRAVISFVPEETRAYEMFLARSCEGVLCADDPQRTCRAETPRCEPALARPEELAPYASGAFRDGSATDVLRRDAVEMDATADRPADVGTGADAQSPMDAGMDVRLSDAGSEPLAETTVSDRPDVLARSDGPDGDVGSTPGGCPFASDGGLTVTQLVAGSEHFCALLSDCRARCWGSNASGQLGDGTIENRPRATPVANLESAVELCAGQDHSCARLLDGTLRCWGSNSAGQVGSGTNGNARLPSAVPGVANAISIACGYAHSCAARSDGTVQCWGQNWYGQRGNGITSTTTEYGGPTQSVSDVRLATSVRAGADHNCAMLRDYSLRCWGRNSNGQVGNGDGSGQARPLPAEIWLSGATRQLYLGGNGSIAILASGEARGWGELQSLLSSAREPRPIASITSAQSVAIAGGHTCYVDASGAVSCIGSSDAGQLGVPSGQTARSFVSLRPPIADAREVAASNSTTCARRRDGSVWCWGRNTVGQRGNGTLDRSEPPLQIASLTGVTQLVAGERHVCALRQGGALCWGSNAQGQLGDGTNEIRMAPTVVPALNGVTRLAAGRWSTCAMVTGGAIYCWGSIAGPSPTRMGAITAARDVSIGVDHLCIVMSDATVSCLARSSTDSDALGRGANPQDPEMLMPVVGISNATQVVSGNDYGRGFSCVLLASGGVRCWGTNFYGQLGDGSNTNRSTPVDVVGIDSADDIQAFGTVVCAHLRDGSVMCWGSGFGPRPALLHASRYDGFAQGRGLRCFHVRSSTAFECVISSGNVHETLPVEVSNASDLVAVATFTGLTVPRQPYLRAFNFCALHSNGTVSCQGDNSYGQLGQGGDPPSTPRRVVGLP